MRGRGMFILDISLISSIQIDALGYFSSQKLIYVAISSSCLYEMTAAIIFSELALERRRLNSSQTL